MAIHIGLRSISSKSNKAISIALWVAVCAHAFAWFYWQPMQKISVPELPDWVNIKLVAGFEEQETAKPQPKPVSKAVPAHVPKKQEKVKPVEKPVTEAVTEAKTSENIKEKTEPASASTYVKADSKPFVLDNPKPVYPSAARRRGMQGVVLLQVNISAEGNVTAIHVMRSSGFRILDITALNSVKQWRFMPARKGNTEVASTVQVPVRFMLNDS